MPDSTRQSIDYRPCMFLTVSVSVVGVCVIMRVIVCDPLCMHHFMIHTVVFHNPRPPF